MLVKYKASGSSSSSKADEEKCRKRALYGHIINSMNEPKSAKKHAKISSILHSIDIHIYNSNNNNNN